MKSSGLIWEVGKGADCPECGQDNPRLMRVRLGDDPFHQFDTATARRIGQCLVKYADAIDGAE